MARQESLSYYAQKRCYTTEVKEYLYQKLRDTGILGDQMTLRAYYIYSKIRKEVSLHVGRSRKYNMIEKNIAIEFIDEIFVSGEYEKYIKNRRRLRHKR